MAKLEEEIKEEQSPFDSEGYLLTFKNIRGQFRNIIEKQKENAYKEAYNAYMKSPKALSKLSKIKDDDLNADLERQLVEGKAVEHAEKVKSKASPKTPLQCSIFLRKYIRFVRIRPEGKGQKAPLYFYDPDSGIYSEDNELLQDLMVTIYPNITERQAIDTLYKISHSVPLRDKQSNSVVIGSELYNNQTGEFQPFNPNVIATRKVKTEYNPNAVEPTINGWKPTEWLKGLFNHDKESYELAIQIIRATVTGKTLDNIFWLHGVGGTGKGTFQTLLENLVGAENIASYKIDEKNGRFDTSILIGKSVVIGDDVQKDVIIKDTSIVFSLATGDPIRIEDKGKRPYTTRLKMTVVQSSNGFPRMNADKNAIDRRFRVLSFSELKGKPDKRIKNDYINRPEVLEYLVKLAIETPFKDIEPQRSIDFLNEEYKEMNPVADFVDRFFNDDVIQCKYVPNGYVFECFKAYCKQHQNSKYFLNEVSLHKQLKPLLPKSFRPKKVTIPKEKRFYKDFNPNLVFNPWHFGEYYNGREHEKSQNKAKPERGYERV
ncbi:phage/plasmid primase, P4 family [Streptococcus alactolyticus]|uniref:phage/plasmid primase, P4 family n=1 Tax=Streptococcus alactolyticus TaxID=29389 RepID=UPI003AF69D4C